MRETSLHKGPLKIYRGDTTNSWKGGTENEMIYPPALKALIRPHSLWE